MSSEPKAEVVKLQRPPVAMNARGVVLQSMDDLARFATMYFESQLAPPCFKSAQAVAVAMQTGMEAGLSPAASVRSLIVIENAKEPMWRGQAALGLIRNSKVCDFLTIGDAKGEGDERSVTIICKRQDMPAPVEISFSVGEARRAGLLGKNNWKNYQDDMLVWRTVGRTSKRYFSDVLMGLDIAEVAQDYTPIEPRPSEPPSEPDPLLSAASEVIQVAPESLDLSPQEHGAAAPIAGGSSTAEPIASLPMDEQLLASLVEKLEGKIVSAESFEQLEAVWLNNEVLEKVNPKERARLTKLYKQNLRNFEG